MLWSITALGQHRRLTDQDINSSGVNQLVIWNYTKDEIVALAEKDINNKMPFLILQSGIAPVILSIDSVVEKAFNFYYREEGCTGSEYSFMKMYNERVFEYLTKVYGNKWIRKVRKDVVGFREWRRKKH